MSTNDFKVGQTVKVKSDPAGWDGKDVRGCTGVIDNTTDNMVHSRRWTDDAGVVKKGDAKSSSGWWVEARDVTLVTTATPSGTSVETIGTRVRYDGLGGSTTPDMIGKSGVVAKAPYKTSDGWSYVAWDDGTSRGCYADNLTDISGGLLEVAIPYRWYCTKNKDGQSSEHCVEGGTHYPAFARIPAHVHSFDTCECGEKQS